MKRTLQNAFFYSAVLGILGFSSLSVRGANAQEKTQALQGGYQPVAIVNDVSVTPYDIEKRIILLRYLNNIPESVTLSPQDKNAILRTIIDEVIKAQEVTRFKADATEDRLKEYLGTIAQRKGKNLKQFYTELEGKGVPKADIEKIFSRQISWQDFMQGRYGRDVSVSSYEISQILESSSVMQQMAVKTQSIIIPFDSEEEFIEKKKVAEKILQRIRGGQDFDSFKGAYQMQQDEGMLPLASFDKDVQGFLMQAVVGDISALIRTQKGIQILLIDDKKISDDAAYSYENAPQEMKMQVMQKLKQHKLELKEKEYLRSLRTQAVINLL